MNPADLASDSVPPPATPASGASSFYDRVFRDAGYADFPTPQTHFAFDDLSRFIESFDVRGRKCLEIGCGRGLFQDLVEDYTGVDLSQSVRLRKPFACAAATRLPFGNATFDVVWSITVLEHVDQPEAALAEIRRVLKPGGLLFLKVAWHCRPWICEGIPVRRYADLSVRQRWIKATLPIREWLPLRMVRQGSRRLARLAAGAYRRPFLPLPVRRLPANYKTFWMVDSDAAVSLDAFDVVVWFRSRGDGVLSHRSLGKALLSRSEPIIVRVRGNTHPLA